MMASSSSSSSPNKKSVSRKASFIRRQLTLMRKAKELSTLCGIDVCVICYGPDGALEIWPEPEKVKAMALKYKGLSVTERRKRSLNLSGFLEKIKKNGCDFGTRFGDLETRLDGYSTEELSELDGLLEQKLRCLQQRLRVLDSGKQKTVSAAKNEKNQPMIASSSSLGDQRFSGFDLERRNVAAEGSSPLNYQMILSSLVPAHHQQTESVNLQGTMTQFSASMLRDNAFIGNGYNDVSQYVYHNPGFSRAAVPQMMMMIQQNHVVNAGGGGWPCNLGFQETGMMGESIGNVHTESTSGFLMPQGLGNGGFQHVNHDNNLMLNNSFNQQLEFPSQIPVLQLGPFSTLNAAPTDVSRMVSKF